MRRARTTAMTEARTELKVIYEKPGDDFAQHILMSGLVNWQPLYDLYLVNDEIYINIELPGVSIEDFTLYVGNSYLIIYGNKKPSVVADVSEKHADGGFVFHTMEIDYGRFVRRIDLPVLIEPRNFNYRLENGILTIRWQIMKEHVIPIEEE